MKKPSVAARKVACRAVFALGCFVCAQLVGVRGAQADSARKVQGFDVLGTVGYGIRGPYATTFGLDLGYTLPFGFRFGADTSYGFGRTLEEKNSRGETVETIYHASFTFGGSLGWDFLLPSFRLRADLATGLSWYSYDSHNFEGAAPGVRQYLGPRLVLLWQYHNFEFGLQTKYWVMEHDLFYVGLMGGVRF
ncbi:MAG TPA: hypothetical protein VFK05_16315 [Polyangiaceae bacterium]|nr:hypothetical protein [Polyangiaceae bacterium]